MPGGPAGTEVDLAAHYGRERRALFERFSAAIVASLLREWQLEGRLPRPGNLLFHALGLAGAFAAYVVLLFTWLQQG